MNTYIQNRQCPCMRCKMNDMLWPTVFVVSGVMIILNNVTYSVSKFTVIGVLCVAVGVVKVLQSSASIEGHIPPGTMPASAIPPVPPPGPSSQSSEVQNG